MAKYRALVNVQFSTWGFAKIGEEFESDAEIEATVAELLTDSEEEPKPKRSRRKAEEEAE